MLWRLSYSMTGSAADADDIAQETFARALERRRPADDPYWRPWLIRVATNLSIDELRRRRRRRYAGDWLPSPVDTTTLEDTAVDDAPDASHLVEQTERTSYAFLIALEKLTPRQRAVVVLRDVADYSVGEVGRALRMSDANVRITHHRARRILRDLEHLVPIDAATRTGAESKALQDLLLCLKNRDVARLEALLSASIHLVTDGGGEFNALRRPLMGRSAVMHLLLTVSRRRADGARIDIRSLNGRPALRVVYATASGKQAPRAVLVCALNAEGKVEQLLAVLASRKLTGVSFDS